MDNLDNVDNIIFYIYLFLERSNTKEGSMSVLLCLPYVSVSFLFPTEFYLLCSFASPILFVIDIICVTNTVSCVSLCKSSRIGRLAAP